MPVILPRWLGFRRPVAALLVAVSLAVGPGSARAANIEWQDPFLVGDPSHYPQPEAVERVERAAEIRSNPSMEALAPGLQPKDGAANQGARIDLLQVVRSDEIAGARAPEGMEAVILVTRWTNVHARQKVSRAQLEGKADRSFGAGSLHSGGNSQEETVDVDVAYTVPVPSRHLWLIAGGEAYPLRPESRALPDGLAANLPFGIARQGESREARLAWFLPRGRTDIELRLFDYDNGDIVLAVAGDPKKAEAPAAVTPMDAGKTGELELAVLGVRTVSSYAGRQLPQGWHFVAVDLLGRSIAKQGGRGALVFADPVRYAWLAGNEGSLRYGLPPEDGSDSIVFTPEIPCRQSVTFVVPDREVNFSFGLRGRSEVLSLKATRQPPAPLPPTTAQWQDGGVLTLGLVGLRRESGAIIVDLLTTPQSTGKGVEIDAAQQFLLLAGEGQYRPDAVLTRRLFRQPPEPFVLPPGTPVRFELAYAVPAGAPVPSSLHYRGFSGEGKLPLDGNTVLEPPAGSAGSMSDVALEAVPVSSPGSIPSGRAASEVMAAKDQREATAAPGQESPTAPARPPSAPPAEKPGMMPIALPAFDPASATAEVEPNNKPGEATPLGQSLAAGGALGPDDDDWFTFRADGEPQLWAFEAVGPKLRQLGVYASGNRRLVERDSRGKASVRLDNLLLLPGQYWIKLLRTGEPAEYTVRAVPLGRPDKTVEFEPNDHPFQAHILRFGEPRTGLVGHQDDVDNYRFAIDVATHLALVLTPPPELRLTARLEGGKLNVRGSNRAAAGEPSRYEALLMPGQYKVSVQADEGGSSDGPYELRLDRLDPFDVPLDLSPNDTPATARKLGGDVRFEGSVGAFAREDWFQLPAVPAPTRLALSLEGTGVQVSVRQAVGNSAARFAAVEDQARRTANSRFYQASLAPESIYWLQVTGGGDYRLGVAFDPPVSAGTTAMGGAGVELAVKDEVPDFGAYLNVAQQGSLTLAAANRSQAAQNLSFKAVAGTSGWEADFTPQEIALGPGQVAEVRGMVRALPDRSGLESVPLYVRAEGLAGGATATVPLRATCGAPPLAPAASHPLPDALLGGLNLAWSGLGAEPLIGDTHAGTRQTVLFDGMTPLKQRYEIKSGGLPVDITVRLAGEEPAGIAGVSLFPGADGYSSPIAFTVLVSEDGAGFEPAYSGVLETSEREQAFVFDRPRRARQVRLHLEAPTSQYGAPGVVLSEWKVIAVPGSRPLGDRPLNIAEPRLGGHVAWASWKTSRSVDLQTMLTEEDEGVPADGEELKPIEWAVGFHHDRAARITRIQWVDSVKAGATNRRPDHVSVSVSEESPLGPWRPLADWDLQRDPQGTAEIVLETPVWARFVRFAMAGADVATRWQLAETLRIFEQGEDDGYRSILGEWGHYRREAIYEAQAEEKGAAAMAEVGDNASKSKATPLPVGRPAPGRVEIGTRDEWYRIDAPADLDRLELTFSGDGAHRLDPALEDAQGNAVLLEPGDDVDGARVFRARVEGGASYLLKVAEAKRSILISWDNSGSVGDYHETLYRAVARFADDIRPDLEAVNLMPLRDGPPQPLLPEWTSDPLELKRAIGSYDRRDQSSDSENTLLAATKLLAKRPGNRGIVLLTDADSPGIKQAAALWEQFQRVQPRIYTLELQLDPDADKTSYFQDLMQDWAMANHGAYAVFRNQTDLDIAFDRAACMMRRPADYRLSWTPAPGAGSLNVAWETGKAMSGATVELVLDASGSMKFANQMIDGKLKIDVAKEIMQQIIDLLPADTRVGLRVYGHRRRDGSEGACEDSELISPIATLNRKRLVDQIQAINALGGTPIAYSLERAGEDLARIEGPRLIVLITDGKEECNGDPAEAVANIRAKGVDARVDIVGFALADRKDKEYMEKVAAQSGGRFFDAQNREALADAIGEALAMPFEILDSREQKVAEGLTGQQAQILFPGNYTVIVHTATGDVTVRDVILAEARATKVILAREDGQIRTRISAAAAGKE